MSVSLRKIEYYSIVFNGEEEYEDSKKLGLLIQLLDSSFIYDDEKSNKFWCLDKFTEQEGIIELIMKSGKYNHSPNYISRFSGNERKSDKTLDEGECEKTHILLDVKKSNFIIESRRSGITAIGFVKYINNFIKEKSLNYDNIYAIKELNPDFLDNLSNMKRVQSIDLYVDNEIIGSDYLKLIEPTSSTQEEVIITIKAERRKSLSIDEIAKLFNKIGLEGEKTKRIRARGKDSNDINVLLDSLNQWKTEHIYVDLEENGLVNSASFFEKAKELI